jgi:hypothetical protein
VRVCESEVRVFASARVATAYLIRSGQQPRLTILDEQGLPVDARQLSDLWQLTGHVPLVLCGGAWSRGALTQGDLPPAQVLLRPFCVGDLVDRVRRVLACPEGDSTAE